MRSSTQIKSSNQKSINKIILKVASLIQTVRVGWEWAEEETWEGGENEIKVKNELAVKQELVKSDIKCGFTGDKRIM